ILDAAGELRRHRPNPLRRELYVTMFGLIAATGLRVSEAIALRLDDVWPEGVLHIRETKFCKSRLVPLHPTVVEAFGRYLDKRKRLAGSCESVPFGAASGALPEHGELHLQLPPQTSKHRARSRPSATHPRP